MDELKMMTAEQRDAALSDLMQELAPVDPARLNEMAQIVKDLQEKVDRIEELKKAADVDLLEAERSLIQLMKDCQIRSFNYAGDLFGYKKDTKVSVLAEDRPQQYEWLRETGRGDLIVAKEDVNANTFGALIRKEIIANGLQIPEFVKLFEYDKLTIKKAS